MAAVSSPRRKIRSRRFSSHRSGATSIFCGRSANARASQAVQWRLRLQPDGVWPKPSTSFPPAVCDTVSTHTTCNCWLKPTQLARHIHFDRHLVVVCFTEIGQCDPNLGELICATGVPQYEEKCVTFLILFRKKKKSIYSLVGSIFHGGVVLGVSRCGNRSTSERERERCISSSFSHLHNFCCRIYQSSWIFKSDFDPNRINLVFSVLGFFSYFLFLDYSRISNIFFINNEREKKKKNCSACYSRCQRHLWSFMYIHMCIYTYTCTYLYVLYIL